MDKQNIKQTQNMSIRFLCFEIGNHFHVYSVHLCSFMLFNTSILLQLRHVVGYVCRDSSWVSGWEVTDT